MEIKEAIKAVRNILNPDSSNWGIEDVVFSDEVTGDKQPSCEDVFDHEYIDQHSGPGEDEIYGVAYFPVGDGTYIKAFYIV
tara:strand:- start:67 stop:309 length:243 start_codon:yes stop_codon:yes gene_type:complete